MIAGSERRIRVELGDARSYDVVIGGDPVAELRALDARSFVVLYDEAVGSLAGRVAAALGERVALTYGFTGGEEIKTIEHAGECWNLLAEARVDRDAVLIAVGGGTLTDLAGFVAATYNRGIRWCALPTTLLAAVDAAVGGKTAINLEAGKNLVGVLYHPSFVTIDPEVFATLDARDLAAGMAEAVKTACVADPELFAYLEEHIAQALGSDPSPLAAIVASCVRAKARIVGLDEHDRTDLRAVLNFGHTVGHALENLAGYGELRHGEAVALGMLPALALSRHRGLGAEPATRIERLIRALPLPAIAFDVDAAIAAAGSDKKRRAGKLRFVLLHDIGRPYVADDVTEAELRDALTALAP
jgi:3-dehydroquinate synthase